MKQYVLLIYLTFFSHFIGGQTTTTNPREMFLEAESYFLYEEYEEALPIYLKLLKEDPTNDNLNYKVGVCYLNIPYEKDKSIKYLEKSSQNISDNYKGNSFKERQAPLDALFYLGTAYRINDQLDKAMNAYQEFKKRADPAIYDIELVDEQIATVQRAKRYLAKPVYFVTHHLGEPVNSRYAEKNAVVSGDESVLAYNVKLPFYEALYVSKKVNGQWQAPQNIIPELGVDGDVRPTGLSYDGKEMIIYRNDNYDGNLYVSRYVNGRWTTIKKLNDRINTKYWESHGSLSPDGLTLYFTSNRKGGFGGLDIYIAKRTNINSDDWTNVTNMGADINTKYNEESPFISQDGKVLYFSSYGHFNMGGYDVFYSSLLDNGRWSAPLNMGYPINTTDDDVYFVPIENGNYVYITRFYPNSLGRTDIYKAEIFSDQHPRKFILKGLLSLEPNVRLNPDSKLIVSIINKASKDTISQFYVNPDDLSFDTDIVAGNYQMIVQGKGIEKYTQDFSIDKNQSKSNIILSGTLNPETITEEAITPEVSKETTVQIPQVQNIPFKQIFFKVFDDKEISILLPFKKGTPIDITILHNSLFLREEKLKTYTDNQNYNYRPIKGINILQFTATLSDNIIAKGEIIIDYQSLSDTLSPIELARAIERGMDKAQYMKEMLKLMQSPEDSLWKLLNETDIDNLKLISFEDFEKYLRQSTKNQSINPKNVDSLFLQFSSQQLWLTRLLGNALYDVTSDSLRIQVDDVRKNNKIISVPEFAALIIDKVKDKKDLQDQLLFAVNRLSWKADAYYYKMCLLKTSSGNLKKMLDSLDLSKESIISGEDLFNFIIDNASLFNYSFKDIYNAYFAIPLYTNSSTILLSDMKKACEGDSLHETISNMGMRNIRSIPALGKELWNIYPNHANVIKLLIKLNDSVAFNNYIANLLTFTRKDLHNLIAQIDLKEQNIDTPYELSRYIFQNKNIDSAQWIAINLYIASKNLYEFSKALSTRRPFIEPLSFTISFVFILLLIIILVLTYKEIKRYLQDQ